MPPMGGRKTCVSTDQSATNMCNSSRRTLISDLVISSGKDPPVFSNKDLRSIPSSFYCVRTEQGSHQGALWIQTDAETLGNTWKVPYRLDGELGDREFSRGVQTDLAIGHEPAAANTLVLWICQG